MTIKLLQFTDLHNSYDFIELLHEKIRLADGVIISGDLTTFGPVKNAMNVLESLKSINTNLMVIPGNCDTPEVKAYLQESGFSIDRQVMPFKGYQVAGLGGSLACPTLTPNQYTEETFQDDLMNMKAIADPSEPFILVSHQPPYQTRSDQVSPEFHVGSKTIRAFIEKDQPLICLCGHIHEGIGKDRIGDTLIVNPGPAASGHYAEIHLEGEGVSVELKQC